ncbi:glycosyltransferase family 2 protein [Tuanshanicoccus lijuaniae]|uniref:glycosyltransferase family 2 protein n=1 Tax=Aerococcaceae bacterium zg-1292 TaxID=2774330 RepID=UPI001BD8B737|nr:glycosyltransferase [Aerococcaceae bacterium zg-A91]MBS4457594.1 glycosyltransferase [Aerococcaceae bacterium zg-BR33]
MDEQLVSIITPVYNAARFLDTMIESIVNQTYQDWELILVDDKSEDESIHIIEQWQAKDSRIRYIELAENSGAAVARNRAMAAARGRWIAFIDSDDFWAPDKLALQLSFMQMTKVAFSYTDFALVDEEGTVIKSQVHVPNRLDYDGLLKNTAIACSTVMIDQSVVGPFRMPLVRKGQDTATWLMLMREHGLTAYAVPKVLNYYRQVDGSVSSNRLAALKRTWHTYRHLEQLPLTKAIYYFSSYVFNAIKRRL